MDDEGKLRLGNALRLISASNEDLFFCSNFDLDSCADTIDIQHNDPFDDDTRSSDDRMESPDLNRFGLKVNSAI